MAMVVLANQSESDLVQQKSQPPEISSNTMFRQLSTLINKHAYIKTQAQKKQTAGTKILSNQNPIKPKSFLKVVTWMKKLCNETLEFCNETLEISVKILKQYLENSNQSPSSLQMLACVCLHLASKLNQKCIIAVESYVECCVGIFTREEFQKKEAQVYEKISCELPSFTFYSAFNFLIFEIKNESFLPETKKMRVHAILETVITDLRFIQVDPLTLTCNILVELYHNQAELDINGEEFLTTLKTRRICF